MTPKEKAKELIHKFAKPIDALHKYPMCYETSKQCALISVDEIIKQENTIVPQLMKIIRLLYLNEFKDYEFKTDVNIYWNEVKQEIQKL